MVIDTSAIVAILLDEPERPPFDRLIEDDATRLVSAITRVEVTFVIESRKGEPGRERLDHVFRLTGAEVVAAPPEQVEIACMAFRRFGKGHHPAGLNLGNVFAYAPRRPPASRCCSRATTSPAPTSRARPDLTAPIAASRRRRTAEKLSNRFAALAARDLDRRSRLASPPADRARCA